MTAAVYYNESDPFCVAWLRALIDAGELPDGEVDHRSITDVRADDVRPFVACHFFAGIGGWPYAFRIAGLAGGPPGLVGIVSLSTVQRHRGRHWRR